MLTFLYLGATGVLLCVEVNVVRVTRIYPRSLLTVHRQRHPDDRDRRACSKQAQAQRRKGFQYVDVSFDSPSAEPEQDGPGA
jgi:membrane protein